MPYEQRKMNVKRNCHIRRRNCLLKQVIAGKGRGEVIMGGRRERRSKQLLDDVTEKRSLNTRWRCVENWLWNRLSTCRKVDQKMNEKAT